MNDNSGLVLFHLLGQNSDTTILEKSLWGTNTNFNALPLCASKTLVQNLNFYNNSKTHVKTVLKPEETT